MCKVSILLASYNGALYIEQQILSIISQTYKDWNLYVRDDGSSDDTINIIQRYESMDDRIHLVKDTLGSLGCAKNFMALLPYSNSEFTIFCDQDDIWLENKLEILVREMEKQDQSIPQLVYSNVYSYSVVKGIGRPELAYPVCSLRELLFRCGGVQGCSSLFNTKLRELVIAYDGPTIMHDFTVTFLGVLFGKVSFINIPLMLYRQHEHNVTGMRSKSFKDLVLNFFKSNKKKGIINYKTYSTIKNITDLYKDKIDQENLRIINEFLKFPNKSRILMIYSVLKNDFTLYDSCFPIILKIFTRKIWDYCTTLS